MDERIEEVVRALRRLEERGVHSVYMSDISASRDTHPQETVGRPGGGDPAGAGERVDPHKGMSVEESLDALREEVARCTKCALSETRTNTVFGVGTHETKVLFIGEAPGRDEDLKGEPFVGRAGKLLDKILAAIDLDRSQVYIANILKCRPPNNRDPQESEVRCCEEFLRRQIALLRPRYICALGRVSAQWLLRTNASLGAIRSGDYEYEGIPVIATYHPAALLRNPNFKKPCWEDMKKLRALLNDA